MNSFSLKCVSESIIPVQHIRCTALYCLQWLDLINQDWVQQTLLKAIENFASILNFRGDFDKKTMVTLYLVNKLIAIVYRKRFASIFVKFKNIRFEMMCLHMHENEGDFPL